MKKYLIPKKFGGFLRRKNIIKFLNNYCEKKYEDLHKYSIEKDIPSVEPLTGQFLTFLVNLIKPKQVLELGCGIGVSTNYILDGGVEFIDAVDANEIRIKKAYEVVNNLAKVKFYKQRAEDFLSVCTKKYDFVFVDTIKKDYLTIWHLLKNKLNKNAFVVFDDVLLYGLVANEESEIPMKYRNGVRELKIFMDTLFEDKSLKCYVFPVCNGILTVRYEG